MNFEKEMETILPVHLGYLKDFPTFPGECVLSSHILSGYFKGKVRIVYGTFGTAKLFHSWIEVNGRILDVTLFQFLTRKEKGNFYRKLTLDDLVSYVFKKQEQIFFDENHPLFGLYDPLFYPVDELEMAEGLTSFVEHLDELHQGNRYADMSWMDSLNSDGIDFKTTLDKSKKQITRRYFTKWAIV